MVKITKIKALGVTLLLITASTIGILSRSDNVEATIPGTNTHIDLKNGGGIPNSTGSSPTISPDGKFVAFVSGATDLVSGDTNGYDDVFIRNLATNTNSLVSISSSSAQASSPSGGYLDVSAGGRFVAFTSQATNLTSPGPSGSNNHIYLRDTQSGTTELIDQSTSGNIGNSGSYEPKVSRDGRFVIFNSQSSNLVSPSAYGTNVYLRDRVLGTTILVSKSSGGTYGNGGSDDSVMSCDGAFVAFSSTSTNLVGSDTNGVKDVFLWSRITNDLTNVTINGDGDSRVRSMSCDGSSLGVTSEATNLVTGDTNSYRDAFVYKTIPATIERISVATSGTQGNGNVGATSSHVVSVSDNGKYAVFETNANNMAASDGNGYFTDIFLRDLDAGTTEQVSVNSSGVGGYQPSEYPSITSDGKAIIYSSGAFNIFPDSSTGILSSATGVTDCSL
jgi:hypothetical protein